MRTKERGHLGEDAVALYLQRLGYTIVERNYLCRYGEIDIVAMDGACLCFVEVKLRTHTQYGLPREQVTPAKQKRLRMSAQMYLAERLWDGVARFDVAEVYMEKTGTVPHIVYLENAFE